VRRLNERQENQIDAQRRILQALLKKKLEFDDENQVVADLTILVEDAVKR
jgi:hypothetical protein